MDSKPSVGNDMEGSRPIRASDRLRRRPRIFGKPYLYYPNIQKRQKIKKRTAACQIAKMLQPSRHSVHSQGSDVAPNLRRSTRKRKVPFNLEDYDTDTSDTDEDLMNPSYHQAKGKHDNDASYDDQLFHGGRKIQDKKSFPRREGLRPRRSTEVASREAYQESDAGQDTSEEHDCNDQTDKGIENGDDEVEAEDGVLGEDRDEDIDDDDGDGKRRYDLRNRAEVRKFYAENDGRRRQRSPRRVLHQGMGTKGGREMRKTSSRFNKRHHIFRTDDSDDSLLVDDFDQGPNIPWGRGGSRTGAPLLFGGLDLHGNTSWALNVAASGWSHHGDSFTALNTGIQTAGPSSKGGADIQPLQIDENISFDDIGGLSGYIDALKEMVFFPLLYPEFFAGYQITPPKGVLLCGPPGTGKTLIARALASAASKAGQKVSFYMRKGADVLSKWVGEAERQLKLLFEEAQRNQPSIIFFDEIDGLAPVRSSKQEQIHNSIVSTLLALMDGLDSRGQVILIGATNRVDAIDGALRRPGRFDREFVFPLPGCDARAEILDIHTRRWKDPPSKELKMELAARCVGYCGADLKALCTEAAIRAFREKYPQIYTSDEKFLIDVNSVKIQKYHFLEAMSTITPAAHRGSIVHSRPLSSVIAPCLARHMESIMNRVSDVFTSAADSEITKMPLLSCGSAVSLVYKPKLLICGLEGAGMDHVGPAVLHELEKFSVHSIGLPSLLSDPSAKTPEEALVHIFCEARRTIPSIVYLPQFHLWWETADEQLKALLTTLLEELPSDFPMLLLGTSSVPFAELDKDAASVFTQRNVYQMEMPSSEDRSLFFCKLVETIFALTSEARSSQLTGKGTHPPDLPKAPKVFSGPKASELKAKVEAEQHALRRLRMCFRDVCNRVLYDKRFSAFHYPVMDEDAPNYRTVIQTPMDMATILQQVDSGYYLTCSAFLKDIDLIVSNAKAYNGDDYNGARIVSRAHELQDAVQGMLSQMDPALVRFCDDIASRGGPMHLPDDIAGSGLSMTPVVQLASVTRASARLRNIQPEATSQGYGTFRRQRRHTDTEQRVNDTHEVKAQPSEMESSKSIPTPPESDGHELQVKGLDSSTIASKKQEAPEQHARIDGFMQETTIVETEFAAQIESLQQQLVEKTEGCSISELERLYACIMRAIVQIEFNGDYKLSVVRYLMKFVDEGSF